MSIASGTVGRVPRVRFGVVVLIPEPAATEIDGLRRAVGDQMLGRVPPHVTLVPPINVRTEAVGDALAAVRRAASTARPFSMTVGPATSFLPDAPVLYLDVGDGAAAGALGRLRDAIRVPPFDRPSPWPFVPHVTLRDDLDEASLHTAVAALAGFRVDVAVDRLHLLQEGRDRVWRAVADAPFAPGHVVGRGGLPVSITVTHLVDPEGLELLGAEPAPPPAGADPLVVTARVDSEVGAVVLAWTRDGSGELTALVESADGAAVGAGRHAWTVAVSEAAERGATLESTFPML
jgi:2'-5' RNA ligase